MKYKIQPLILIVVLIATQKSEIKAQGYSVRKVSIDSEISNEFSPVLYGNGIVFCSDMTTNSLISYKDKNARVFKIVYSARRDSIKWQGPRIFSRELTTDFNDGPVTFNANGDIIYFTRNNNIGSNLKNISDSSNKLGLYSAELISGKWTEISPFKFNDPAYTFCTPSLRPDGKRIYFSTNMPGGFGGMDLYYCDSLDSGWDNPVNIGPGVNTPGNESYPFSCRDGNLYFSSDGHKGAGGKDIFYTSEINGKWIDPVRLDSAINSSSDDFGIVMDSSLDWGYFSTNRRKTDDIYLFRSVIPEFGSCDSMKAENYCFTFFDERFNPYDSLPVTYLWDFGDSMKIPGPEVMHCFPGPGEYTVKLIITDNISGMMMSPPAIYSLKLQRHDQPVIESWDIGLADSSMLFSGNSESLVDFTPGLYMWDFGNGFHNGGPTVTHKFRQSGDYKVQLGLTGGKDSLGRARKKCIMKTVKIFDSFSRLGKTGIDETSMISEKAPLEQGQYKRLNMRFYTAGNFDEAEKEQLLGKIESLLNQSICFGMTGLTSSSSLKLEPLCEILKENNNLRLSISIRKSQPDMTFSMSDPAEIWAGELAMFFRHNMIGQEKYSCTSLAANRFPFRTDEVKIEIPDGYAEFCFIKNNQK